MSHDFFTLVKFSVAFVAPTVSTKVPVHLSTLHWYFKVVVEVPVAATTKFVFNPSHCLAFEGCVLIVGLTHVVPVQV